MGEQRENVTCDGGGWWPCALPQGHEGRHRSIEAEQREIVAHWTPSESCPNCGARKGLHLRGDRGCQQALDRERAMEQAS